LKKEYILARMYPVTPTTRLIGIKPSTPHTKVKNNMLNNSPNWKICLLAAFVFAYPLLRHDSRKKPVIGAMIYVSPGVWYVLSVIPSNPSYMRVIMSATSPMLKPPRIIEIKKDTESRGALILARQKLRMGEFP